MTCLWDSDTRQIPVTANTDNDMCVIATLGRRYRSAWNSPRRLDGDTTDTYHRLRLITRGVVTTLRSES